MSRVTSEDGVITIPVEFTRTEARAFAQFLKRVGHSDYLRNAVDDEQAYQMLYAGEKVREALAEKGFAPR